MIPIDPRQTDPNFPQSPESFSDVEPNSDQDLSAINNIQEAEPLPDSDDARILTALCRDYELTDESPRNQQLRKWRKHINYWNNIQYGAWDDLSGTWKTPEDIANENPESDIDPALYAKVVNVYKAHGEILIGALTTGVPNIRFFPKDADDHDDIQAAKARSKIAELITRQNKARLLLVKSLYYLYNCGFVACYNENKSDFKFGSYTTPDFDSIPAVHHTAYCPQCGQVFNQSEGPDGHQPPGYDPQMCPNCGPVQPEVDNAPTQMRAQVGETTHAKNRECLEVHGPLTVKIPLWVKDQISTPYLCLEDEHPVALVREIYPEFADRIQGYDYSSTEEQVRIPRYYNGDYSRDLCTVQRWWMRTWALNAKIGDEFASLKQRFPKGLYFVVINHSLLVELMEDSIEDHWTIAENPLAESLHADPIGSSMIPLQDIENELDNLTLETIEFGIPEVYADPRVLDFNAFKRQEARPGQVSPASAPAGRSLGEGFYEMKAASLSREVDAFADRMNSRQQFVQGTYPSIYGGAQDGGSGTAREYELSKSSALQRLATTWMIIQEWWAEAQKRAVESFVVNMKADEQFVVSKGSNFLSVWIRQADLSGKVGDVMPEIAEPFPVSWSQKRDVMLSLLQMGNEDINAVVRHPENASLVASTVGVPDLYIPGDDDRNKQLSEISQMITAEPIMNPQTGMPQSSVQVDPQLDNNEVEAEICKAWLKSEVGMDAKMTNPGGYMNILSHMKEHMYFASMFAAPPEGQQQEGGGKPSENINDKGIA